MAKIEQGAGILLSVDTGSKTLRFQEELFVGFEGQPPAREWELPYSLDWQEHQFFDLVGKKAEYVLSDGVVVSLKS